jgi:hypothetical protein
MDLLHGLVATSLRDELLRAASAVDDGGNPIPMNPQLIDKALKFLKDNDITAPRGNAKVDDLAATLGDLDLDAEAAAIRH